MSQDSIWASVTYGESNRRTMKGGEDLLQLGLKDVAVVQIWLDGMDVARVQSVLHFSLARWEENNVTGDMPPGQRISQVLLAEKI